MHLQSKQLYAYEWLDVYINAYLGTCVLAVHTFTQSRRIYEK